MAHYTKHNPEYPGISPLMTPGILEFGLLKAGEMNGTFCLELPKSDDIFTGTHELSPDIDEILSNAITYAHNTKTRQGFFTSPFSVRYALRSHSGKILLLSQPEVMTAGLLPPCVKISYFNKVDTRKVYFKLTKLPYFSLMVRAKELPSQWIDKVKSIDIYASPQIPTFTTGQSRLCLYSDILRSISDPLHERYEYEEGTEMMIGRYSEDGGPFRRHYTHYSLSNSIVWHISPNNDLSSNLAASDRFYRIASIPASDIHKFKSFACLHMPNVDTSRLDALELLQDNPSQSAPARLVSPPLGGWGASPSGLTPPSHSSLRLLFFSSGLSPPRKIALLHL